MASASYRAFLFAGIAASACCHPALAQSAQDSAPEIVVTAATGTSIRGVAPVGAPVIGLNQDDIQKRPAANTAELLREIPSVTGTGANDQNFSAANNANANITAGNGINLRGLGTESTLTLLNGRRLPPAGTQAQFFDPSVFPTSAIGRLEVMADGGSAIYGSDAVGGVVNVLLPRRFTGFDAYVKQGFNDAVHETSAGGMFGKKWSSGNVMVAYEHAYRSALAASARSSRYTDDLTPFGGTDQRLLFANPGNILIGGRTYALPAGQNGVGLTPAQIGAAGTANRESAYLNSDAIPGQKRDSVIVSLRQDIAPGITLWTEDYFAYRSVIRRTGAVTSALSVPTTNTFFVAPAGTTLSNCGTSAGVAAGTKCETVNYSFSSDYGSRVQNAYQASWQVAGGFDADLGKDWKLTAYGSYGQDNESRTLYALNTAALAAALRDTNPATAFNPFGAGSNNSAATLAGIKGFSTIGTQYKLTDFAAKLDGSVVHLPGGDLKLAVGGEYQQHQLLSYTLASTGTANVGIAQLLPSTTRRNIASAYAEAFVPLVGADNAMPLLRELTVSAAVRHDRYSDFGNTTNPKFALNYKPMADLTLCGSYGTSFRAPTLSDIDPSTLTISFNQLTNNPSGTVNTLWVRGGNDRLGPEKATIWSMGFDYKPAYIEGLSLSLTYFNVVYRNRIATPGNDTLALSSASREALLGSLVARNPSADLVNYYQNLAQYTGVKVDPTTVGAFLDGRKVNVGQVRTEGLEFIASYRIPVGPGQLRISGSANYVMNFKQALAPNAPLVDLANTINNPLHWRGRGSVSYTPGGFDGTFYVNYSGGYTNNSITSPVDVPSYTTFDLNLRQSIKGAGAFGMREMIFTINVQNLFDRQPPVVLNGALAFDPQVASILGRYASVGLRAKW
jgi:iron complex outermembrane receptor protein